ncbi:MAG: sulfurtransferase [Ignavibacteria bacterium]|nr:sulfurtransferase [Ignavibacteria bacterium]
MTQELPIEKQTKMQLYVTSQGAFDLWKASPDKVKILDVRTTEEYLFVGHAAIAINLPAFLQVYQWDAEKQELPMKFNPAFPEKLKALFSPDDTILVTCRSGGRGAMAANIMADMGYKNVYNITDGFEGDTINDPESVYDGQHLKNGWKNVGLPWTYDIDPSLIKMTDNK